MRGPRVNCVCRINFTKRAINLTNEASETTDGVIFLTNSVREITNRRSELTNGAAKSTNHGFKLTNGAIKTTNDGLNFTNETLEITDKCLNLTSNPSKLTNYGKISSNSPVLDTISLKSRRDNGKFASILKAAANVKALYLGRGFG